MVFKAVIIIPGLILQKSPKISKAEDHVVALERRIKLWRKVDLIER